MLPSPAELRKTPLYSAHVARGGRLVDFAGWAMPVQYASILAEHRATRQHAGIFDVSHMGRFLITGANAVDLLEGILTRHVNDLPPGRIRYSLITQEDGGILDDVLVYRREEDDGFLLVVNASNRQQIFAWLAQHQNRSARTWGEDVSFVDTTLTTAMIAVQGPAALDLVAHVLDARPHDLRYYSHRTIKWQGDEVGISRTGYTGEDGVELIIPAPLALPLWEELTVTEIQGACAQPAGLGARDTLRLEAGMPLYGQELGTWCDPFEAGLDFAVDLERRHFPGCEALDAKKGSPPDRRRVGLLLSGRRPARSHCQIRHAGQVVGEVTSGTFSPTLEQPIAMGYVRQEWGAVDTVMDVDVRGTLIPARVVPLPFYRRAR